MAAAQSVAAAAVLLCTLATLPAALAQAAVLDDASVAMQAAAPALATSAAVASAPAPGPAGGSSRGRLAELFPGQDTVRVVVTPGVSWYSNCDVYDGNPANLTGYEVDLSRQLLLRMGIPEEAVTWVCIAEETGMDVVDALAEGRADLSPSIGYTAQKLQAFSNISLGPVMDKLSYQALVLATPPGAATDSWQLLNAFSPALWLALLGTALGVGLVAFLVEVATQNLHADAASGAALMWDALGRFSQARDMVAFSNAASIMVLAFSFLCFILCALFTATMASRLTASQLRTGIRSMADLAGRRVALSDAYLEVALQYGVRYEDVVPFDNQIFAYAEDVPGDPWYYEYLPWMLSQLRSGALDAFIMEDLNIARDILPYECDMVVLPPFETYMYSPMLRGSASPAARAALASAALAVVQDGTQEAMYANYTDGGLKPACNTGAGPAIASVTFDQVASLWVLLGAGAAASLLLVLLHLWQNRWWPSLRERPWVHAHLSCEGKGGGCSLPSPPKMVAHAIRSFEAATAPYTPPASGLPVTSSVQPCDGDGGPGSDGCSLETKQTAPPQAAGNDNGEAAEQRREAADRRANEDRREAAYQALPAQLQTGAVGEVARTYARLNSSQGVYIGRLLQRVKLRGCR